MLRRLVIKADDTPTKYYGVCFFFSKDISTRYPTRVFLAFVVNNPSKAEISELQIPTL